MKCQHPNFRPETLVHGTSFSRSESRGAVRLINLPRGSLRDTWPREDKSAALDSVFPSKTVGAWHRLSVGRDKPGGRCGGASPLEEGPTAGRDITGLRSKIDEALPWVWETEGERPISGRCCSPGHETPPRPWQTETKNTTAHSDQRLFNKESRQDNPTPQFRYPQGQVGPTDTWKHSCEGPCLDFPVKQGGWHLSGAPGTSGLCYCPSGPHCPREDFHVLPDTPSTSLLGRPREVRLSSPTMGDTSNSLRRGAAAPSVLGMWGEEAEVIFLHQASPWGER